MLPKNPVATVWPRFGFGITSFGAPHQRGATPNANTSLGAWRRYLLSTEIERTEWRRGWMTADRSTGAAQLFVNAEKDSFFDWTSA
jgi:hypothetical protein